MDKNFMMNESNIHKLYQYILNAELRYYCYYYYISDKKILFQASKRETLERKI